MPDFIQIYKNISYTFQTEALLEKALTHRSTGPEHNERMEFLGDSVVNFVIASELYLRFPEAPEGELSRRRANLVKRETLAELARELDLGSHIRLGIAERKSGGAKRDSILSDAFEAIIGAMYLDSRSLDTCYTHVLAWYEERLKKIINTKLVKDPKSRLQELVQAQGKPLPNYEIINTIGAAHKQVFKIQCQTSLLQKPALGEGTSRQRAEQSAAENALKILEKK